METILRTHHNRTTTANHTGGTMTEMTKAYEKKHTHTPNAESTNFQRTTTKNFHHENSQRWLTFKCNF